MQEALVNTYYSKSTQSNMKTNKTELPSLSQSVAVLREGGGGGRSTPKPPGGRHAVLTYNLYGIAIANRTWIKRWI